MLDFVLNRFKEQTTWYGLLLLAGSFGLDLTEMQQNAIMIFGMAMVGAPDLKIEALKPKKKVEEPTIIQSSKLKK